MKKFTYNPFVQVVLFLILFSVSVFLMKYLFHISERWVNYVASAGVAILTFLPEPIMRNVKYRLHKKALKKNYKDSLEIDFGIDGYAFCDHDDRGYVNSLIRLETINEDCVYDPSLPFMQNAERNPKLHKIADFIEKSKSDILKELDLNAIMEKKILPQALCALDDKTADEKIYLVDSIRKNRKDQTGHEEASVLVFSLTSSNRRTKAIIDTIYRYLKDMDAKTMTASYKTSNKPQTADTDIEAMMCFITTLDVYGCIIKQDDEPHTFYVQRFEAPNRIHIPLDTYSDINGRDIAEIVDEAIQQDVHDRSFTRFTDVALSYMHGVTACLLCCVKMNDDVTENENYIRLTDGTYTMTQFLSGINHDDAQRHFFYSYAVSLMRKIDKNRFEHHL